MGIAATGGIACSLPAAVEPLAVFRGLRCALATVLIATLAACAGTPTGRIQAIAQDQQFHASTVQAMGFAHLVFSNRAAGELAAGVSGIDGDIDAAPPAAASSDSESTGSETASRDSAESPVGDDAVLHVYLEGDGSPWKHRTVIMPDPTPRRPVMLRLMGMDTNAAVYIGRPCYNGTSLMPECDNGLWTSGRYSETVVRSMQLVLRRLIDRQSYSRVRLFGHSGGGTLAMLLAARVPEVEAVVTLAGNLDVSAWTRHHHYTPLYSSLDPAQQPVLPDTIRQWHLLGARDSVIPPGLVQGEILRQGGVGLLLAGFSHGCCWQRVWPQVLAALTEGGIDRLPGARLTPQP